MDDARRALVRVSAALSPCGGAADLREALKEAADVAEPTQVEEVLLQAYLFAGYPTALNAFRIWREVSGRAAPAALADDADEWARRGPEVFGVVYGEQAERLRSNVAALHPDLDRWALNEGYGKVLGRPGLDLATRELCIAALLAGMDAEPQLYAHARGALNAGATEDDVEEALREAARLVTPERARAAREVWARVRERRRERNGN
ncbi:MAG TPA: carboxymuconolactone decarboxylase family protein [Longimicrobiales bacterium]